MEGGEGVHCSPQFVHLYSYKPSARSIGDLHVHEIMLHAHVIVNIMAETHNKILHPSPSKATPSHKLFFKFKMRIS